MKRKSIEDLYVERKGQMGEVIESSDQFGTLEILPNNDTSPGGYDIKITFADSVNSTVDIKKNQDHFMRILDEMEAVFQRGLDKLGPNRR